MAVRFQWPLGSLRMFVKFAETTQQLGILKFICPVATTLAYTLVGHEQKGATMRFATLVALLDKQGKTALDENGEYIIPVVDCSADTVVL